MNENYVDVNVAAQEKDENSILNFYRKAIAFRKNLSCVRNGNYTEFNKLSPSLYTYSREDDKQKILVACSYTEKKVPFKAPEGFDLTSGQLITVYSEEAEGYLENIGFLFQQMDLYLQTLGLGVCWLGMGRMNPKTSTQVENMKFVIMLAFGYPRGDQLRQTAKQFKRKAMEQITDRSDPGLEPARLAPSAVNSQPWFFTHAEDTIHVYCANKGSRLDVGIALAHLYVANEEDFRFFKAENVEKIPGYGYVGSVTL